MSDSTRPAVIETPHAIATYWRDALWSRVRNLFWLKLIGVTAFVWLFFVAYFYLLQNPSAAVTEMPLTALDHWIAFQPLALVPYLSLWLYVGIAPGLMPDLRQLIGYGLWAAALCATGLAIFYLWPTAVPADAQQGTIELLRGLDAAGNACPSLHVATATFSAVWIEQGLRTLHTPRGLRVLNALWFVAIAYSTMAIKQHVLLDVVAGMVLGVAFAWLSLHWQGHEVRARRSRHSSR